MELVGEVPEIRERLGGGRQRDERLLPSLRLSSSYPGERRLPRGCPVQRNVRKR